MAVYLIDYENTHQNGISGIDKLTERDSVIIFVGNKIKDMPTEIVETILDSPARVKIRRVKKTADNYLDFQLATCLGSLIAGNDDREFFIISSDHDFEAVINYWNATKASVRVERRVTIAPTATAGAAAATKKSTASKKLSGETMKKIKVLVKDEALKPHQYSSIYRLFIDKKEAALFHEGLVHVFKQERGDRLYDLLKDVFDIFKSQGKAAHETATPLHSNR